MTGPPNHLETFVPTFSLLKLELFMFPARMLARTRLMGWHVTRVTMAADGRWVGRKAGDPLGGHFPGPAKR